MHTSTTSVSYNFNEIEPSIPLPYLLSKESLCLSSPYMEEFSPYVIVSTCELSIPSENSIFGRFHLLLRCSRMLSFPPLNSMCVLRVTRHCRTGSMYPCKASHIICFSKFLQETKTWKLVTEYPVFLCQMQRQVVLGNFTISPKPNDVLITLNLIFHITTSKSQPC